MIQGTPEWFAARLGKVTASCINKVMATLKSGGEAADRKNYRAQLVAERLTGRAVESYTNAAMAWGTEQEPFARQAYEFITGNAVEEIGFIEHPVIEMCGCSPDGLIGEEGMVEIKSPNTATHIDWLLSKQPPAEHLNQMQWQMECSGRKWCDFVSYDPRMPLELQLFTVRVERDDKRIGEIREAVKKFLAEVDETISRLQAA